MEAEEEKKQEGKKPEVEKKARKLCNFGFLLLLSCLTSNFKKLLFFHNVTKLHVRNKLTNQKHFFQA